MINLNASIIADSADYDITSEINLNLSKVSTVDVIYYENTTGRDIDCMVLARMTGGAPGKKPSAGATVTLRAFVGPSTIFSLANQQVASIETYVYSTSYTDDIRLRSIVLKADEYLFVTMLSSNGADNDTKMQCDVFDASSNYGYAANSKPQVDTFSVSGNTPATQIDSNLISIDSVTSAASNLSTAYALTSVAGVDIAKISGDTSAASNLEATYENGGLYALQTTVSQSISTTAFRLTGGSTSDEAYEQMYITVTDADDGFSETRIIASYTSSSKTVGVRSAFTFAPGDGDIVTISAMAYSDPQLLRSNPSGNTLNVSSSGKADTSANSNIPPRLR